jgi:hypothetical protein
MCPNFGFFYFSKNLLWRQQQKAGLVTFGSSSDHGESATGFHIIIIHYNAFPSIRNINGYIIIYDTATTSRRVPVQVQCRNVGYAYSRLNL